MNQLVCLSYSPWEAIPTRTQHLLTRLKNTNILFFEPAASPREKSGRKVRPNITVYALPAVILQNSGLFRLNLRRQCRLIESKLSRHQFRSPLLWVTSPEYVHHISRLPHSGLVYDCDRDWSQLPIQWESELALDADVIFAASPWLAEHLSPCSGNIVRLPNGGSHALFSRTDLEKPSLLSALPGPVICHMGALDGNLNIFPLLYAADAHPEWTILLLCDTPATHPALRTRPNIRCVSNLSLVEMPDYLTHSQVCVTLLRQSEFADDVIPAQLYDYFSTGLPIVSMIEPEQVEEYPDVIYSAHSPEEFTLLCEHALTEAPAWVAPRRRNYGATASWSERAAQVSRILSAAGLLSSIM